MFQKADRAKFIDWPSAVYSMHPFDTVAVEGETVGVSTWIGYTANEGRTGPTVGGPPGPDRPRSQLG
jgi:hypothetical protein